MRKRTGMVKAGKPSAVGEGEASNAEKAQQGKFTCLLILMFLN